MRSGRRKRFLKFSKSTRRGECFQTPDEFIRYSERMITTIETSVLSVSPDVMSGAAVFTGTRVPAQSLLDYLAAGHSLEEFLIDFPTVTRERAVKFLQEKLKVH